MRNAKTITATLFLAAVVTASQSAVASPTRTTDCGASFATVPKIVGLYYSVSGNPSSKAALASARSKLFDARICLPGRFGRNVPTTNPSLDGRIARQTPKPGSRISRFSHVQVWLWEYRPSRNLFHGSIAVYNALPGGAANVAAGTVSTLDASSPNGYVIRSTVTVPKIKKDIFAYEVFLGISGDSIFAGGDQRLFGAYLGDRRALSFRVVSPGSSTVDTLLSPGRLASWSNGGTIHIGLTATMVSLREQEELTSDTDQISLASLVAQFDDGS